MKHLFSLLCLMLVLGYSLQLQAQTQWTKDPANPVLSGGAAGSWNQHVFQPFVLYNPDSSFYQMWYTASFPGWFDYQIGYAKSPDGVNWTRLGTGPVLPVTAGAWDSAVVGMPCVIVDPGQYKMWYNGVGGDGIPHVGYATSPDGINWTKYAGNPVITYDSAYGANGGVASPWVVAGSGVYEMIYATGSPTQFCRATSVNGIQWDKDTLHSPIMIAGTSGTWDEYDMYEPRIVEINSILHMWYTGRNNVDVRCLGHATSSDGGLSWTKDPRNPVLRAGPSLWDSEIIEGGSVLLVGKTLHLWYCGARYPSATYYWHIGHATSPSPLSSFACDMKLGNTYLKPGVDTLWVRSTVNNPSSHNISVMAYFKENNIPVDSSLFLDDGCHHDSAVGDNVWGAMWKVPAHEKFYKLGVVTSDTADHTCFTMTDSCNFTTAGPIIVDSSFVTLLSGGNLRVDIWMKNMGSETTTPAIRAPMRTSSPIVKSIPINTAHFGDIAPGSRSLLSMTYVLKVDTTLGKQIPATFDISSNYVVYWQPEMTIVIPESPTGVVTSEKAVPTAYLLAQNYPNPFNPNTMIHFELPKTSYVQLKLFNLLGQELMTVVNENRHAGRYDIPVNLGRFTSGIYFYKLVANDFIQIRKMVLIK